MKKIPNMRNINLKKAMINKKPRCLSVDRKKEDKPLFRRAQDHTVVDSMPVWDLSGRVASGPKKKKGQPTEGGRKGLSRAC